MSLSTPMRGNPGVLYLLDIRSCHLSRRVSVTVLVHHTSDYIWLPLVEWLFLFWSFWLVHLIVYHLCIRLLARCRSMKRDNLSSRYHRSWCQSFRMIASHKSSNLFGALCGLVLFLRRLAGVVSSRGVAGSHRLWSAMNLASILGFWYVCAAL